MFSGLTQGSLVYILDKTKDLKYKVGEVVGITQPKFGNNTFNPSQPNTQTFVDIKLKIDNSVTDFNAIPSANSLVTYNNGSLILSETKQGLQTEIESIIQTRKQALDNVEQYRKDIVDGENILKELNPQFAKDKARDDQISTLNNKVSNMEDTLNKIVTMLSDSTKH